MSEMNLIQPAAAPLLDIVRDVSEDDLGSRTPCAEFDVRALVNHLLYWGPSLEAAATGGGSTTAAVSTAAMSTAAMSTAVISTAAASTEPAGIDAEGPALDHTAGDWAGALHAQVARIVRVWTQPSAWEGTTRMGGPMDLPAELVGGMVAGELVLHGWDLARAIGSRPVWDEGVLVYVLAQTARSAELGRSMGIYGPEVPVPTSAPTLDRVLGLSGRDPGWTPAPR